MSGERSKKSGEYGEKLAEAFLKAIGWHQDLKALTIPCTNTLHTGDGGNARQTHGGDRVFLYNNPFYENRTDIVHVSVKNNIDGYPETPAKIRAALRTHVLEANEIIACARYDNGIHDFSQAFPGRKRKEHSGLLIWTSSHNDSAEDDVLGHCEPLRGLDDSCTSNVYLVDGARIAFILRSLDHARAEIGTTYRFYFPDTGLVNKSDERHGTFLPLELVAADMLPVKIISNDSERLHLYVRQPFDRQACTRAIALALSLTGGWGRAVRVGFPDYNPAQHDTDVAAAKLPFSKREQDISAFCYVRSNLNALETP
ncbi:hypothetical protein P3W24_18310 [Luteibacter sp. PPL201]|uniref:GAPS4 PD-(D/E)XK nuclease domain-containing protein n=1 Tax=Luteibacter sahnii TaxID=3021977 RepID=A0ABT6BFN5_9GAMM